MIRRSNPPPDAQLAERIETEEQIRGGIIVPDRLLMLREDEILAVVES